MASKIHPWATLVLYLNSNGQDESRQIAGLYGLDPTPVAARLRSRVD
jgi:hypothetical protein